jgi:transposase
VVVRVETRQVIDVPAVAAVVSDHVVEHRRCGCGTVTAGEFPAEATAPVCYGSDLAAFAVYLMAGQHLPMARTAELICDLWGLPVSEGWLAKVMERAGDRLAGWVEQVKARLRAEPVVHADETSVRVGAGLEWVHVVSTGLLTLLAVHPRRGRQAMDDIGVLPGFAGTVVHDGWIAYEGIDIALSAQCGVHLLRYLRALTDGEAANAPYQRWAAQLAQILHQAASHARTAAAANKTKVPRAKARRIRTRWAQTLAVAYHSLPAGPPPRNDRGRTWTHHQRRAWNLVSRLDRHTDQILRLLDDTAVPMDNNQAERDLRMIKLHDKISGCFRNPTAARNHATIRSYLQTGAKHGHDRLRLLQQLFTTGPWTPPPRTTT